ncbi:DpnD/PcfM family protein [Psychrobacter sp. LV10R520-6]|uniref:DpnD/PcfM family protein n=1 Tax=Psychrobacter sp. LV10R520-6 TaxID=1415574 RepID=UPI0024CCECBA|nr:DpnD/PcfM family protein [Psychrobacter sp. LV10R520-6]SNT71264.1 DpnD/PcfM-like protein [Psychrobacter sp. LV10R520-6]
MSKNVKVEKTFHIEIVETLSQVIEIVAEDEQSALLKAQQLYRSEEVVLDSEDYMDTKYNIFEWE